MPFPYDPLFVVGVGTAICPSHASPSIGPSEFVAVPRENDQKIMSIKKYGFTPSKINFITEKVMRLPNLGMEILCFLFCSSCFAQRRAQHNNYSLKLWNDLNK